MPWDAEDDIDNSDMRFRYCIYSDWDVRYATSWDHPNIEWNCPRKWKSRFDMYPECDDEDGMALKSLCESVRRRVG